MTVLAGCRTRRRLQPQARGGPLRCTAWGGATRPDCRLCRDTPSRDPGNAGGRPPKPTRALAGAIITDPRRPRGCLRTALVNEGGNGRAAMSAVRCEVAHRVQPHVGVTSATSVAAGCSQSRPASWLTSPATAQSRQHAVPVAAGGRPAKGPQRPLRQGPPQQRCGWRAPPTPWVLLWRLWRPRPADQWALQHNPCSAHTRSNKRLQRSSLRRGGGDAATAHPGPRAVTT
jgi:hypothetical protein